ncbi:MAG: hypothetical protein ABJC63_09120 [Gemmatimonadales bacterium]
MSKGFFSLRGMRGCAAVLAVGTSQLLSACQGILDVSLPGKVPESALASPGLSTTRVAGVQADFECAFTEYVHDTGLWSNELLNSSANGEVVGWGARLSSNDNGLLPCQTAASTLGLYAVYVPLQTARVQAESAITALDGFTDIEVPTRTVLTATALVYAGFAYTLLGEGYCQVATGPEPLITPAAALGIAEARFTRAIALATTANNSTLLNAARIGRARVRLDLKNGVGAAADAKSVTPASFVFNATYSTQPVRRFNTTVASGTINAHESIAPEYRGLTVGAVADSRVPVIKDPKRANGQDGVTPLWLQQKYSALDSPLPIATWDEAQLILAEAEPASAVAAITAVRSKYNLPAYTGTGSLADIQEERRRTLFLDGHRLGDMLRYNIPFASGKNQKGVSYSNLTCLPLPSTETAGR